MASLSTALGSQGGETGPGNGETSEMEGKELLKYAHVFRKCGKHRAASTLYCKWLGREFPMNPAATAPHARRNTHDLNPSQATALAKIMCNAAGSLSEVGELDQSLALYEEAIALALNEPIEDAFVNAAATHMKLNQCMQAYDLLTRALDTWPGSAPLQYNLNTCMRRIGKTEEAIAHTFGVLSRTTNGEVTQCDIREMWSRAAPTHALGLSEKATATATVLLLKWGKKYGSEYVNRLARGIARKLEPEDRARYRIVCFTDDAEGIEPCVSEDAGGPVGSDFFPMSVKTVGLPSGGDFSSVKGWWWKAYLFSNAAQQHYVHSDIAMYIDLDTIVTGSISFACDVMCSGAVDETHTLTILGTEGMVNEQRDNGYNSSVMLWNAKASLQYIWDTLLKFHSQVNEVTYKFDHWMEMLAPGCRVLQVTHPNLVVEYLQVNACSEDGDPQTLVGTSLVTFPLHPKPHELEGGWALRYWA